MYRVSAQGVDERIINVHYYYYFMEVGEEGIIYISLHCHHQNDLCIKMGRDASHFNVS